MCDRIKVNLRENKSGMDDQNSFTTRKILIILEKYTLGPTSFMD